MPEPLLHPTTDYQLNLFKEAPSHALALTGPRGSGRATVAQWLISNLLGISIKKLLLYPYLRIIRPVKGSISIDSIRGLNSFLKLKTLGQQNIRRFVIIEYAETMTIEAQNALLKSLEDPPSDTLIILTVESDSSILPTILSRLQRIHVHIPSKKQLESLFDKDSSQFFNRAYDMSDGLPGLLHELINDNNDHPFILAVAKAKEVLGSKTTFDKLKLVDNISKQKEESLVFLQALKRISDVSIKQSAQKEKIKDLVRWQKTLITTYCVEEALLKGASTKLALTYLMLNL